MKKVLHWLDENLEEFLLVGFLIAMTLIMGIQVLSRYVLGNPFPGQRKSPAICSSGAAFLSVSYCSKMPSIKIEQFVVIFLMQRQSALQGRKSHLRADLFPLYDPIRSILFCCPP